MLERDVDSGSNKRWADDQAADLGHEACPGEGIVVSVGTVSASVLLHWIQDFKGYSQHDPTAVADCLTSTTKGESNHVSPCLVADTLDDLDEKAKCEERSEEAVRSERRVVAI